MDNAVASHRTDSERLNSLEGDVIGLQVQVKELDTRTVGMDKKLDQLLIREEAKKGHEPSYYIGLVAGTLMIAGVLFAAANWYIKSAIGDTVGTALTTAQHQSEILDMRIKRIEQAFSWTPTLISGVRIREVTQ